MPITEPYDAPSRAGLSVALPVAAATTLYAGGIVGRNAAGDLVAAADTAGIEVLGRLKEDVDNSAGSAGDLTGIVEKGVFGYDNSATNPITKDDIGRKGYIEDDSIISTDPGDNNIVAGEIVAFDDTHVYVDFAQAPALQAQEALDLRIAALEA